MKKDCYLFLWLIILPLNLLAKDSLELKVDSLNEKAWANINNSSEAIRLSKMALQLADSINYLEGVGISKNRLGVFYTDSNDFEKADSHLLEAEKIRWKIKDTIGVADVYDNLCRLKKEMGNYLEAIRYGKKALDILRPSGRKEKLPTLFLNLAIVHQFNNDTADARSYYWDGLYITEHLKEKDTTTWASFHYNLGNFYCELVQFDSAQFHLNKALPLFIETGHKHGEAAVYQVLGEIFTKKEDYYQAHTMFKKSIAINVQNADSFLLFHNFLYLSKIHEKQGSYEEALRYCDTAKAMLTNIDRIDEQEMLNRQYSNIFYHINNYEKAYHYLQSAEGLKDSLYNKEKNESIQKLLKEQAERENAETALTLRDTEIRNQRLIIILGITGFLILIAIFGLYLLNQRRIKKEKELIDYKERQERDVDRRIIEAIQRIRKKLSFQMHDHVSTPLTHIKRFIEPIYKQLGFDAEVRESLSKVIQIADNTHIVSRDIAHELKPEKIDWLEKIKLSLLTLERKENVNTKLKVAGLKESSFSKSEGVKISALICNILNNVDKHSLADKVKIHIEQTPDSLNIIVEDNGKGFDPEMDKGIGIESIHSYIKELNGMIKIESAKNTGTLVKVKIPITK